MQIEKVHKDGVHEFVTMLCFDGIVLKSQMAVLGLWKDNKVSIEGHWCGGTKAPRERMGAKEWVCVRSGQGRSLGGGEPQERYMKNTFLTENKSTMSV